VKAKPPEEAVMRIYVGNLPDDVKEEDLRPLFAAFGQVQTVQIIMDHASGKPRGFAFVKMAREEEAAAAMRECGGMQWRDRTLILNKARHGRDRRRADRRNGERRMIERPGKDRRVVERRRSDRRIGLTREEEDFYL
jgi:RNA recognition motif-containing protein